MGSTYTQDDENTTIEEMDWEIELKKLTEQFRIKPTLTFEEVGEFINSQEFVELIAKYKDTDIYAVESITNKLIGIAMDYADIFRNSGTASLKEMKEILNGVVKRDVEKIDYDIMSVYEKKLLRDLGLHKKQSLTPEEDEMVKHNVIKILAFKQTKFHAFNGAFLSSIQQKGLNPHTKFEDEQNQIEALLKKYNLPTFSINSDNKNISYSATASVSYNYSRTSPEWFARMCGTGYYATRNYKESRGQFEHYASAMSEDDSEKYLDLFESCWQKFAKNNTYLCVVPDVIAHEYEDLTTLRLRFDEYDGSFAFKVLAEGMRRKTDYNNERTDKTINVDNASFIELPDLKELTRKVEEILSNEQTLL